MHGWYPLLPPAMPHNPPVSGPTPQQQVDPPKVTCSYVGGVEISAAFASKRDRQLVLSAAEQAGWQPAKLLDVGGRAKMWEVTMTVTSLWLQRKCLLGTGKDHSWCFVRYKFFDMGEYGHAAPIMRFGNTHPAGNLSSTWKGFVEV